MRVGTLSRPGRAFAHPAMPLQVLPTHDWHNLIRAIHLLRRHSPVLGRYDGALLAHIAKQLEAGSRPLLWPVWNHAQSYV